MADCPQSDHDLLVAILEQCKRDHDLLIAHLARFEEYCKAMEDRLGKLNELREQTSDFQKDYLRYDVYNARDTDTRKRIEAVNDASGLRHDSLQKELEQKIDANQTAVIQKIEANFKNHDDRIGVLSTAQNRMLGMGAMAITAATLAGGLIGALIGHMWR